MGLEVLTGERTQHAYRRCQDEDCQRYACRVYREGFRDGHAAGAASGFAQGHAAGHATGYAEGRADGYADGASSCGDG
jgi:flagellar biosynthesis/type III secretory pathway protein FliH